MAIKKRKYPKAPKQTASLAVWERHRAKVQEVDRYNSNIEAAKKKKAGVISQVQKMKAKR